MTSRPGSASRGTYRIAAYVAHVVLQADSLTMFRIGEDVEAILGHLVTLRRP